MWGLLIALLGAASAFLFSISLIPSKSPLDKTLDMLQSHAQGGHADDAKKGPLENLLTSILPAERAGSLSRKLIEAGWYTVTPAQIVLRMIATGVAGIVVVMLVSRFLHFNPLLNLIFEILLLAMAFYAPWYALERAVETRKEQVQKTLPDFLDMISSTVRAGLSINASLAYAVDAAPGALGDEIKEALSEVRLGRPRTEALKAVGDRLRQQELTTTISAITQAERLGANISKVLSELADDCRTHRILIVEEHAAKLPVKMVFPMAFFMLPSLFVIIFGSLVANYLASR